MRFKIIKNKKSHISRSNNIFFLMQLKMSQFLAHFSFTFKDLEILAKVNVIHSTIFNQN